MREETMIGFFIKDKTMLFKNTVTLGTLAALMLLFVSSAAQAESACKGLASSQCSGKSDCVWVGGYTRKDNRKVSGYCRAKGGKGATTGKTKRKKTSSSNDAGNTSKGSTAEARKKSSDSKKKATNKKATEKQSAKKSKKQKTTKKKSSNKSKSASKKTKTKEDKKTKKSKTAD